MEKIPQEVADYLKTQKVGVLAVLMPDGSPHAASLHFAHTDDPFVFLMQTGRGSRKCEALLQNSSTRASLVIGVDLGDMKTLQLDGIARTLQEDEADAFTHTYLTKFPSKEKALKDPNTLCILFTPSWWRFTDWTGPEGRKVWSSE